jgi:ankyrin repeat protein|uniref:Uncharacterized protein n=1 Tax=Haptolina ericina TaxID=156174 RepID=A0A7S3APU1_9EUKA
MDMDVFAAAQRGDGQAVINAIALAPRLISTTEDANGWTLLHIFSRLSMPHTVQQLLTLGADPERRDRMFRSALHMAARADVSPTLSHLASDGTPPPPPGNTSPTTRTQLAAATVSVLLKGGARVTARDSFGLTALHHAAQAGHTELVELLLGLNTALGLPRAPLESETNAEERPLHLAAQGGHVMTVKRLLEHGAHPEKTNYVGHTALHLAVSGGDAPAALLTVQEMVKRPWRVNLNAAARDGCTPLHLAAAGGHGRMAAMLLSAPSVQRHGGARAANRTADLRMRDRSGRTPEEVARVSGLDDVAGLLRFAAEKRSKHQESAEAEKKVALEQAMREMRFERKMPDVTEEQEEVGEDEEGEDD